MRAERGQAVLLEERAEVRLRTVAAQLQHHLVADEARLPGSRTGTARLKSDRAVDAIRQRFGRDAVSYGAALLGTPRAVPDAFRHLAEKSL
mgnify:CR=1 FL=1